MKYDPELILQIPPEVKEAFSNLVYLCQKHQLPRNLIYNGAAWNIAGVVENKVHEWLFQ